ncbi:MAG: Epidermal growth factor receptor [Candidatus Peregrinibacteria bacterium GW2011_GWA2_38_36]|nr:MAG: Epidermal growth factor receptor [Candidatus Peregrinibacteria bacterium GW2011_GWA2_38_36]
MGFFEDLQKLRDREPRNALVNIDAINSAYCSYCYKNKSCYLIYASDYNEDCLNSYFIYYLKDSAECAYCYKCELCFECIDCDSCYSCNYTKDSRTSSDLQYCDDCNTCDMCFGCVGLRQKKHHIFNKDFESREAYLVKVAEIKKQMSHEDILKKVMELRFQVPILFMHQLQNEKSLGDYLYNSKGAFACFDSRQMFDSMYMNNTIDCKDCMDCSNFYHKNELCYECVAGTYLYNSNYCYSCFESRDLQFCENLHNCNNCFGCCYLKRREYCILNQQFTPEEYAKKVAEIKKEINGIDPTPYIPKSTYPYEDSLAAQFWTNR